MSVPRCTYIGCIGLSASSTRCLGAYPDGPGGTSHGLAAIAKHVTFISIVERFVQLAAVPWIPEDVNQQQKLLSYAAFLTKHEGLLACHVLVLFVDDRGKIYSQEDVDCLLSWARQANTQHGGFIPGRHAALCQRSHRPAGYDIMAVQVGKVRSIEDFTKAPQ